MKLPLNSKNIRFAYALVCALGLFPPALQAKTYPPNIAQITGANIAVNDTIKHHHAFFSGNFTTCSTGWEGNFTYKEVRNVVSLFVNDEPTRTISNNFTATVRCMIRWKDAACTTHVRTVDLTVAYDTARGAQYVDRDAYTFTDGNYVEVIVKSITIANADYKKYLVLRSSIEVTRYGEMLPEILPTNLQATMGADTLLRLSWDADTLAEEYDLEWVWVDDYDSSAGGYKDSTTIPYDFRGQGGRITLDTAGYVFQPVYERGWLLFRVRYVGRAGSTFEHRVLGRWSDDNISSSNYFVGLYPVDAAYHIQAGHRQILNWQYGKTFTENAQFKEVITYFDGMLRSRQNVTRIQTVDMAVVNEDVYDYAGRKAISVIPTPVFNKRIDFYALFNTKSTGVEYKTDDFDLDSFNCERNIPKMNNDKGASKYYSSSNPYATSPPSGEYWHQYVPQAGGYPYSLTTYMPDPTGRIREQGGVGPYHQPTTSNADSAGHTIKYYYGTPTQTELDRLFGSNVGYAQHYESKITVDQQGNATISYIDLKGNVIATALVGDVIKGYDTLDSYVGGAEIVNIDFTKATSSVKDAHAIDFTLSTSQSVLLANDPTELHISYALGGEVVDTSCMANTFCNDCIYELYFSVKNQCGQEMLEDSLGSTNQPVIHTLGKYGDHTNWCNSGMSSYDIATDTKINVGQRDANGLDLVLDRGSYTITREIRPSMKAAEEYAQRAIDSSSCLPTLQELVDQEMALEDTTACELTCTSCNERLGTLEDFTDKFLAGFDTTGISGETDSLEEVAANRYKALKYNCDVLCRRSNQTPCGQIYEALRTSFTPGGNYATLTLDTAADRFVCTDDYSIFNPDSNKTFSYKKYAVGIRDDSLWTGSGYKKIKDLTPHELYIYWQPWIADSLVKIHPEYCQYTDCRILDSSHNFDEWLRDLEDIDVIKGRNFMDLFASPDVPYIVQADSFSNGNTGYQTAMKNKLRNYGYFSGNYYNMFQIAVSEVYCNATNGTELSSCLSRILSDEDLLCDDRALTVWDVYRNLYLAAKDSVIRATFKNACYNSITEYPGIPRIFPKDILDTLSIVASLPGNSNDYDTWGDTTIENHCETICQGYRKYWLMRMSTCPELAGDSVTMEAIADDLETVCVSGCNKENPLGSNAMSGTAGLTRFDSVLQAHLAGACYGLFIDVPGGPNDKYTLDIWPLKNNCPCEDACKIERYFVDGDAYPFPGFVRDTLNFGCGCEGGGDQAQYEKLKKLGTGESGGCLDRCYECSELAPLVDSFMAAYPEAIDSAQLGAMLTHYLNYNTGLDKTWSQYLGFFEGCTDLVLYTDSGQVNEYLRQYSGEEGGLIGGFGGGSSLALFGDPEPGLPPAGDDEGGTKKLLDDCACDSLGRYYKDWMLSTGGTGAGGAPAFDAYVDALFGGGGAFPNASAYYALCHEAINTSDDNADDPELPTSWDSRASEQITFFAMNFKAFVPQHIACHPEIDTFESHLFGIIDKPVCEYISDTVRWFEEKMHDSCWSGSTTALRDTCRAYWGDSLKRTLNLIYYGDVNHGTTLAEFQVLFQECSCAGIPPSIGIADELEDGQICSYQLTSKADTLIALLNHYIDTGYFSLRNRAVKPVAPYYFGGPLNVPFQSDNHTIRYLNEYWFPGGAGNKFSATSQRWDILLRDTLTPLDSLIQDKMVNIYIYSENLSTTTWPTVVHITQFRDPAVYAISGDSVTLTVWLDYIGTGGAAYSTLVYLKTNYIDLYSRTCKPIICREKYTTTGPNACIKFHKEAAEQRAMWKYEHLRDSAYAAYKLKYLNTCYTNLKSNETFDAQYDMVRHHITLFYFDQANNLVQTVPPAGVVKLTDMQVTGVQNFRNFGTGTTIYPGHTLKSVYRYTSTNQKYQEITPDADTMRIWYDPAGRAILSQNGEQKPGKNYSYTYFDELSRPIESGRLNVASRADTAYPFFSSYNSFYLWAETGGYTHSEITMTYYDAAQYSVNYAGFSQDNLRKRITSITYQEADGVSFDYATHYSYDVHGNIKELVQQIPELADIGHNYKLMRYEYDMISNKVTKVLYEPGFADAFYHRYFYDADNRITTVETSPDNIVWDKDAEYYYYLHGPLARVELGYKRVQGLDYAYTLQGWLKGVNSSKATQDYDMGRDGYVAGGNPNQYIARDVFGYTLGYFKGDFTASGSGAVNFEATYKGYDYGTLTPNLYNGNIRSMAAALWPFTDVLGRAFAYDQVNRLTRTKSFLNMLTTNSWNGVTAIAKYQESFTYDANGNILTAQRYGNSTSGLMDNLTYSYYSGTNKLQRVDDAIADASFDNDFDDNTTTNNFTYDQRGNLTNDVTEHKTFSWNNRGKLASVITGFDCSDRVTSFSYKYDAMNNRVKKVNVDTNEYYIRDAQGNTMAIYRVEDGETIELTSQHLYGSSRLGQRMPAQLLDTGVNWDEVPDTGLFALKAGIKEYELTNHLGNVLATITDRRLQRFDDTSAVDYYEADITSAQDYYAFGALLPGRQWTLTKDAAVYTNQCVKCKDLRRFLKTQHSYSTTGTIAPDTVALTDTLNAKYEMCQTWSYWRGKIFTTCKLWDSVATWVVPTPAIQQASISFGTTASYTIGTSNFSVEAWVLYQPSGPPAIRTIMSKYHVNPLSGEIGGFHLFIDANGRVDFKVGDAPVAAWPAGREGEIRSNAAISTTGWTHIVVERIGNNPNGWKIYINGAALTLAQMFIVNATILPNGGLEQGSSDVLYVGGGAAAGAPNSWSGRLRKARLFKTALSGAQVSNEKNGSCGTANAIVTAILDAPLNSYRPGSPFTVKESALNRTGTEVTGAGGIIAWAIQWYDSACNTSTANTNLWCNDVLTDAGHLPNYGFNGKWRNDDLYGMGDNYDFGDRIYDSRLGRFFSVDPMSPKYPDDAPYSFAGNSPYHIIDVDGNEKIVVTGGADFHNKAEENRMNFANASMAAIKLFKKAAGKKEKVTWVVFDLDYTPEQKEEMIKFAAKKKIDPPIFIKTVDELTDYVNNKHNATMGIDEKRSEDLVTSVAIFSHGTRSNIAFDYANNATHEDRAGSQNFNLSNYKTWNKSAFATKCNVDIYSCNAATNTDMNGNFGSESDLLKENYCRGTNLVEELAFHLQGTVTGYLGRTTYAGCKTEKGCYLPRATGCGAATIDNKEIKSIKLEIDGTKSRQYYYQYKKH